MVADDQYNLICGRYHDKLYASNHKEADNVVFKSLYNTSKFHAKIMSAAFRSVGVGGVAPIYADANCL